MRKLQITTPVPGLRLGLHRIAEQRNEVPPGIAAALAGGG